MTQQEINDFKASIIYKQCEVGMIVTNIISITGRDYNEESIMKYNLIDMYCNILLDYFEKDTWETYNFFTKEEILQILKNFNALCHSDISLKF